MNFLFLLPILEISVSLKHNNKNTETNLKYNTVLTILIPTLLLIRS